MSTNLRGRQPRNCRVEFRLNKAELESLEMAAYEEDCTLAHFIRGILREYTQGKSDHGHRRRKKSTTK